MKLKILFASYLLLGSTCITSALVINEVMSNPIGDDSGREWIELYNDSTESVDLSTLTISIKGGTPLVVTPLSGGTTLSPSSYAIIGSVVSGATRFGLDYPEYSGPLFKSSISLVNTGITSLDIRLQGTVVNSISSYTAAKEGHTYSHLQGTYGVGTPTPGRENESSNTSVTETSTTTTSNPNQVTIAQMSPPSADMIIFLPKEKTVVAGALTNYSVSAMTNAGKAIENVTFKWAFGDGGQQTGSSTMYRYVYPGKYIIQVEGGNGLMAATGRMNVRVVAPDVLITNIKNGKYGPYISLINPNSYDLDISDWKISIDGSLFSFPKNTLLGLGETRFPGSTMGFASTTYGTSTVIKLLFPTMDELLRIQQETVEIGGPKFAVEIKNTLKEYTKISNTKKPASNVAIKKNIPALPGSILGVSSSALATTTNNPPKNTSLNKNGDKDTRIATFIRSWFSK